MVNIKDENDKLKEQIKEMREALKAALQRLTETETLAKG